MKLMEGKKVLFLEFQTQEVLHTLLQNRFMKQAGILLLHTQMKQWNHVFVRWQKK